MVTYWLLKAYHYVEKYYVPRSSGPNLLRASMQTFTTEIVQYAAPAISRALLNSINNIREGVIGYDLLTAHSCRSLFEVAYALPLF